MLEILIFIHSNIFLMNKIRIKSLLTKNPTLNQRKPDLHLLSQFQYCQVFVGSGCYMIQYSIYDNFYAFCKNLKSWN